jgi:hypothetical protein
MRNENGISIIIADSEDEALTIAAGLGITETHLIEALPHLLMPDLENEVFIAVLNGPVENMKSYANRFNVRRGVLSVKGKREFIGFNVDWMKKLMSRPKPSHDEVRVLKSSMPVGFSNVFEGLAEKDDPHADLGYRR